MFETHESAREEVFTLLNPTREHAWAYVYTRIHMHWFHVCTRSRTAEDGYRESRNIFLYNVIDLLTLMASKEWEVEEVSLVSPAYMNKSGHWQMDQLKSIVVGRESQVDHEQYGYIFILDSGKRYVSSIDGDEVNLTDLVSVDCIA